MSVGSLLLVPVNSLTASGLALGSSPGDLLAASTISDSVKVSDNVISKEAIEDRTSKIESVSDNSIFDNVCFGITVSEILRDSERLISAVTAASLESEILRDSESVLEATNPSTIESEIPKVSFNRGFLRIDEPYNMLGDVSKKSAYSNSSL